MNLLCILLMLAFPGILYAENKTVVVEATYIMGDGESPVQAEAKAFDAAKEKAITQLLPFVMEHAKSQQLPFSPQQVRAITEATAEVELLEKKRVLVGERLQFTAKVRGTQDNAKVLSELNRREKRMRAEKLTKEASDIEEQILSKLMKRLHNKSPLPREDFASDYRKAFKLYSQAIDTDPTFATPYFGRHSLYKNEYSQENNALADLTEAIRLEPSSKTKGEYYFVRGEIYKKLGDFKRALADYDASILTNPTADFLWNRGLLLEDLGQYEKAILDYSRIIQNEWNKDDKWYREYALGRRAASFDRLKQYPQALADYTELIRLTNGKQGYNGRAMLYMELHELEKAVSDFTQEIAQRQNSSSSESRAESESVKESLFLRALAYNMLGQHEKVVADITEYLILEPKNDNQRAAAYDLRGRAYGSLKQEDKALADYTEAIRYHPQRASTYYRRGMTYAFMRVWDRGTSDLTEALRLHHMDSVGSNVKLKDNELASAYLLRGGAHLNLNHLDQSLSDLNEALRRSPKDTQALFWRGLTYAQLKDTASAGTDLRQACQLRHEMACKALQSIP